MKKCCKKLLPKYFSKVRHAFVFLVSLVLCFTLITSLVFAEFLSSGHRKGVAVANGYYFTSNVLNSIINESAPLSTYYCADIDGAETQLDVYIRNYNNKKAPNPFEITYTVKCRLNKEPPKKPDGTNYYNYSVQYKDPSTSVLNTEAITSSTDWQTLGTSFNLGTELDFDKFTVVFDKGAEVSDISKAASVNFIAIPNSPLIMTSYLLGANIELTSKQAGFAYTAKFEKRIDEYTESTNISDFAGFLYEITTSGVIGAAAPQLRITWQADKIDLSQENDHYADVVYQDDTNGNHILATLTMEVNSGEYITLPFYRTDNWNTAYTLADLKSFVTTEQIS